MKLEDVTTPCIVESENHLGDALIASITSHVVEVILLCTPPTVH